MNVNDPRLPEGIRKRITIDANGCWCMGGHRNPGGYTETRVGVGKKTVAHRVVYEVLVGPIPKGLTLDHLCRVPWCVNPDHLEPVTLRENIMRGTSPVAAHPFKTHCPAGHPYAAPNLYVRPDGRRACRACVAASQRRCQARKKLAKAGQD